MSNYLKIWAKVFVFVLITLILQGVVSHQNNECNRKDFGSIGFVCVCNATSCHRLPQIPPPGNGSLVRVTSSKADKRWLLEEFSMTEDGLASTGEATLVLKVNRSQRFQHILGFGGAFTDATGINLQTLSKPLQDNVMNGYFGVDGLEYNLGRVPIGGTDFSTHPYTYDDLLPGQVDPTLKHFRLAEEDFKFKIPYLKQALALSSGRGVEMKLYASPWSGPSWMKTNGRLSGNGKLKRKFYAVWANYVIRFLQEYGKEELSFFAVTSQNEPTAGMLFNYPFNEMWWTPTEQTLQQTNASKYVGGIAVHWYWDSISPAKLLDLTHDRFPNIPILYTEACEGWAPWHLKRVVPGSWVRAEHYAQNIIEDLQHWVVGWTDWNLALNLDGGPNWVHNFVDSPILVNEREQEVYKQPMYYALAHFSKVIPEGSVRIGHEVLGENKDYVDTVAFLRPDGSTVVVLLNVNRFPVPVALQDGHKSFTMIMEQRSIVSLVWNP